MNPGEKIQLRDHGGAGVPTLVYLPGLHGDWTLIGAFRKSLAGRARFVEVTYPRTLTWSLDDYAAGVESALAEQGITRGWLLGESFGSQVVWPIVARRRFLVQAVILAGGFVNHPMKWAARMAARVSGGIPADWLARALSAYARLIRRRYRRDPGLLADLKEFVARRTEPDLLAMRHRLRLVASNAPGLLLTQCRVPIFALAGLIDPVVPWPPVRRLLKRNSRTFQEFIILRADHNVLSSASRRAADQVCRWMRQPY
jgi:pimeloyl-ACP methyl ester carboxylesterase